MLGLKLVLGVRVRVSVRVRVRDRVMVRVMVRVRLGLWLGLELPRSYAIGTPSNRYKTSHHTTILDRTRPCPTQF